MIDYPKPPGGDISPREGSMLRTLDGHRAIDRFNATNNDPDDADWSRNVHTGPYVIDEPEPLLGD